MEFTNFMKKDNQNMPESVLPDNNETRSKRSKSFPFVTEEKNDLGIKVLFYPNNCINGKIKDPIITNGDLNPITRTPIVLSPI